MTESNEEAGRRWERRPVLSVLVRALVFLVPVGAGVGVAVVMSRRLPSPEGALQTALWWLSVWTASTASLIALERLARRFLPLASLLNLSLLFPTKAPRRMALARRVGTVRQLEQRLEEARQRGVEDDAARAAESILTLVAALQLHDRRTRGHAERVRVFTDLLVEEMGLPQADRDRLRWAALLHDIGKLAVSADLLNKPERLSEDEWHTIQRHPEAGASYCGPLLDWLGPWGDTIAQHHERWDGGGYPRGLAGEEICLGARIVAVPDAFEVMTSARAYKLPVSSQAARDELARQAGSQFDPAIVRAFLNLSIRRLRWVMGPAAWLAQMPFVANSPQLTSTGAFASAAAAAAVVAVSVVGGGAGPAVGDTSTDSEVAYGAPVTASTNGMLSGNSATDLDGASADHDLAPDSAPTRTPAAGPRVHDEVLSAHGTADRRTGLRSGPDTDRPVQAGTRDRQVAKSSAGTPARPPHPSAVGSHSGNEAAAPRSDPRVEGKDRRPRQPRRERPRGGAAAPAQTTTASPPVRAADDTATVAPGGTVSVPVLANDSGALEASTLDLVNAVGRGNGSVETSPDGTITFTDGPSSRPVHKVKYVVCDENDRCDRAVLTITVNDADAEGDAEDERKDDDRKDDDRKDDDHKGDDRRGRDKGLETSARTDVLTSVRRLLADVVSASRLLVI